MYRPRHATMALAFSSALVAAASSAFGAVNTEWTFIPGPPGFVNSIAAFPAGVYASSTNGIYAAYNPSWTSGTWTLVVSTPSNKVKQITSDVGEGLYIINSQGFPQQYQWNGKFANFPPGVANSPGLGQNNGCSSPTDMAVGEDSWTYVVGCGNNEFWAAHPKTASSGGVNWGAIRIGSSSNTLVAVAANQMVAGAWVIDSAGGTWFVNESGSSAQQIARPEFLQPASHQIGLFGGLNNVMAIGGGNVDQGDDHGIVFWENPGWVGPYLGGYAHTISVNQYTAAVLAVVDVNDIYVYSLD